MKSPFEAVMFGLLLAFAGVGAWTVGMIIKGALGL